MQWDFSYQNGDDMFSDIGIAFDEFSTRIQLTANQTSTLNARFNIVKELLEKSFPATDSTPVSGVYLMGSGARSTVIRPFRDLDVFTTFTNKEAVFENFRGDSQKFLYRVRERVGSNTSVIKVGARGQAVRLFYSDNIHVDIAPAFRWSSGGFGLPSGNGTWLTTDPLAQSAWARELNRNSNHLFSRRVRMLKRWNFEHSSHISSWHLEALIHKILPTLTKNSRVDLDNFFRLAIDNIGVQDPDGFGGDLSQTLTREKISLIRDLLITSADRSRKAINAEYEGNARECFRLWRVLLGEEFPSYG